MVSNLPADRDKWLLEPKLDGCRAIAVKSGGRADLYSMDENLYNVEFSQILEALQKLRHQDVILDGEILAVEPSGRPEFQRAAKPALYETSHLLRRF
jgi:bifunctional non-homologous end joining protein LigD